VAKKMDVDFWNGVFQWGGIVLLALTFLVGAGALLTGGRINARQTERLLTLETDRDTARAELAKQQRERAANAERMLETERGARLKVDQHSQPMARTRFFQCTIVGHGQIYWPARRSRCVPSQL
jgi:hypothetical protein